MRMTVTKSTPEIHHVASAKWYSYLVIRSGSLAASTC